MAYDIGLETGLSNEQITASIVGGAGDALEAISQAAGRRVDIVMLGDSNQQISNYGFTRGIDTYLSNKYGQYATPILDVIDAQSVESRVTRGFDGQTVYLTFNSESESASHLDLWPHNISITTDVAFNRNGFELPTGGDFDYNDTCRVWCGWGGETSGDGEFKLGVRYNDTAATVVEGDYIQTNTGSLTKNTSYLDFTVPEPNRSVLAGMCFNGNRTFKDPFTFLYLRMESLTKNSGVSCHTLIGAPGESLYDFAGYLGGYGDSQLTNYFTEVRRLQLAKSQTPIVVVYINSGINDRTETSQPTRGVYELDSSSSKAGYLDNLSALLNRIERIWNINGWPISELYFLCVGSHVIADPNDTQLTEYREGLKELATSKRNLTSVDLSEKMTYEDAAANGWYKDPVSETVHLTEAGYNAVSGLIFGE